MKANRLRYYERRLKTGKCLQFKVEFRRKRARFQTCKLVRIKSFCLQKAWHQLARDLSKSTPM